MLLKDLLAGVEYEILHGTEEKDVQTLSCHSKECKNGTAFFAIRGREDGNLFFSEAIANGAEVCITDASKNEIREYLAKVPEHQRKQLTVIKTNDCRKALAECAGNFFGHPEKALLLIGVTGTKGKTTTTFMIKKILEDSGIKTGIIGTVQNGFEGNYQSASATTPCALDLYEILRQMQDGGCRAAVLEVSSQGMKQHRIWGLHLHAAVFTNLAEDHISPDEHENFEEYLYWKSMLFRQADIAIVNGDDPYCEAILKNSTAKQTIRFGMGENVQMRASDAEIFKGKDILGIRFFLEYSGQEAETADKAENKEDQDKDEVEIKDKNRNKIEVETAMPGMFSLYNAAGAITAACAAAGIDLRQAAVSVKDVKVRGRAEIIPLNRDFMVMIDYAHNGAALQSLLINLRKYRPERLIVVFGCGGQRDRNRRVEMGKAAGTYADFSIITSDNPRSEEPMHIIQDISEAMGKAGGSYRIIPDRRQAIAWCLEEAWEGDFIVIAGKGHETYQVIGNEKIHFDDRQEVLSFSQNLK